MRYMNKFVGIGISNINLITMSRKIGIIGSGIVAQTLGTGFLKHGYEVMLGSRHAKNLAEWLEFDTYGGKTGSLSETAAFGELIVLATRGSAAKEALGLAGVENLNDKTVIDATNPIQNEPPDNGVLKYYTSLNESQMEMLQKEFPKAKFVKAFNSVGAPHMVNPSFESKPTMFTCGNDEDAKSEVNEILDKFGWEVEDMGMVEAARAIEPLCILWCIPGLLNNKWSHAFKLLKQ